MAKNISILGASYSDVPAVTLPTTQGGTASFTDITDTTATDDDVVEGKVFYSAGGVRTTGTGISRNQVQTLVEENKVKHIYGVDGYTENLIDPIYFDGDGRLYTPGQNDTKTYWTQNEYVNFLQTKMTALAGAPCFLKVDDVRWPLYANLNYSTYAVTLTTAQQTATISISTETNRIIITFSKTNLEWTSPLQIGKLQIEKNSQSNLRSIVENRLANAAEGEFAHAEGDYTFAQGMGSHAEGGVTQALRNYSHAQGNFTVARGFASHAEGEKTYTFNVASHAEGSETSASGNYSHAEGYKTKASDLSAHAEGNNTIASALNTHAEGSLTTASGGTSHAEGSSTTASGNAAHAEGQVTIASNNAAHAEGDNTIASGLYSHAEGNYTVANHKSQHVFGQYNIEDSPSSSLNARGDYIEIVGNGTDNNSRSNARTLDWSGNESLAGNLTLGKDTANEATLTANDITTVLNSVDNYTGNAEDATIETVTASTAEYPVPAAGDSLKVIIGKIVKFFSDIRAAVNAKIDSSKITTSLAVTTAGSVADATVSKVLNDKITVLNNSVSAFESNTPLNSTTILNQTSQITKSELKNLTPGIYIIQTASPPSDWMPSSGYGMLFIFGSLSNYRHGLFTNADGVWKITFNGNTAGDWSAVSINSVKTGTITRLTTQSGSFNQLNCYKRNNVVTVGAQVNDMTGNTVLGNLAYFQLPEGFRPTTQSVYCSAIYREQGGSTVIANRARIDSDGKVFAFYGSAPIAYMFFTATFAV